MGMEHAIRIWLCLLIMIWASEIFFLIVKEEEHAGIISAGE